MVPSDCPTKDHVPVDTELTWTTGCHDLEGQEHIACPPACPRKPVPEIPSSPVLLWLLQVTPVCSWIFQCLGTPALWPPVSWKWQIPSPGPAPCPLTAARSTIEITPLLPILHGNRLTSLPCLQTCNGTVVEAGTVVSSSATDDQCGSIGTVVCSYHGDICKLESFS